ncbi:mCG148487 [Mus musculus]|nr:mCG148487 [Mus musculus]
MENSVLIYKTTGYISYVGSVSCVQGQEPGKEQGATYHLKWVPGCWKLRTYSTLPSFLAWSIVPHTRRIMRQVGL